MHSCYNLSLFFIPIELFYNPGFNYRMTCTSGKRTMYDVNGGHSGQLEGDLFNIVI